jgi:hypothetical protein
VPRGQAIGTMMVNALAEALVERAIRTAVTALV